MSRVDFYVLAGAGEPARHQFACRLAEKAYRLDHTVHIRTADRASAEVLDDLLWTFRDGSFVPHEFLADPSAEPRAPVTIGASRPTGRDCDLLINLAAGVPEDCASFPRVAEIVTSDEDVRRESRQRYAQYRDMGHSLETHKL